MKPSHTVRARVPAEARHQLGRAAALHRFHPDQVDAIADAKRQAAVITLEDHIRRVVAALPPLSQSQRDKLALLLRGGDAA